MSTILDGYIYIQNLRGRSNILNGKPDDVSHKLYAIALFKKQKNIFGANAKGIKLLS